VRYSVAMAQDETRATPVAPAPAEGGAATDASAAVRTLTILHALHLVADDPALVAARLDAHRARQRAAADSALAALPTALAGRVRSALDVAEAVGADDPRVAAAVVLGQRLSADYEALHESYDSMLAAMAVQARQALGNAVRSEGRERAEELKDALRLLRSLLDHPIGARNGGAWFEFGWAQMQTGAPLLEVEEAFYQAQRLSGAAHEDYHAVALRYLASTQAAQGRYTDAAATLARLGAALEADPEASIEAARYACGT
jgi:hypothetical protein